MDQNPHGLRTHRGADARIAAVALRQHGAFSREQAVEAGFTRGMIDYRLATGRWAIADFGVYRSATTPPNWAQRLIAACLAGPAVASHRAAGIIWGFPGMPDGIVEVTALRHRRRRRSDVVWHESFHLTERDITEIEGVRATRPVRTFVDLGAVLSSSQLEEVLDNGLHRNVIDIAAIWRRLDEFGDLRPGAIRVRALLESRVSGDRPAESVLETRFRQLMRGTDLPMPTPQFEIGLASGRTARVDFAYPNVNLGIELDGAAYHSGQQARSRDRSRDNRLGALGWRILRYSWQDLRDRPNVVIAEVRTALQTPCVRRP
jgi:very-short-patch-repair endonuclease